MNDSCRLLCIAVKLAAEVVSQLKNAASDGPLVGVMHSFCEDLDTAVGSVSKWGLHISFSGMVTFKKATELRELARQIPLDRILVETDAPYLAPTPRRGKRNEPAYVRYTAACLAEVHGMTAEEFSELTTKNACQLFRLPIYRRRVRSADRFPERSGCKQRSADRTLSGG